MTSGAIITAILDGSVDGDINDIWKACSARSKSIRQQKSLVAKFQLKEKDTVTLGGLRQSSGLNGVTATIIKKKQTKCDVRIGSDYTGFKYHEGAVLTVPMSCCTPV